MGRYLLVTWAGGGNVTPMLVLAAGLSARGHDVGTVAPDSLRDKVVDAGASIVGRPAAWLASADEVLTAIERFGPDALVVDYMLTGALCGAERSGLPTVALVHTLYGALLEDGAPNPIGMAGSVADVNAVRAAHELAPIERHADLLDGCELVLVAAPRALDVEPVGGLAPNVFYTGPLIADPDPTIVASTTSDPTEAEVPLVVVSMGTAGADPALETDVLARILTALGTLPVRGVVNLPGYLSPGAFDPPANVDLTGYVPHPNLLPHTDVVVTHAGLGTVNAALAHGVPMVCVPLDREQPANAAAVERIGAGSTLDRSASADELRAAIDRWSTGPAPAPVPVDVAPTIARLEALVDS